MDEIDFLRGIEGEEQKGTDLVSGAEHLVRLKIQSGQETRPKYDDLELEKKASIKDVAKNVLEGAKGGLKYQGFGAGAGLTNMKSDKARGVGHLLGMAAPAAALGATGYAAGHHAGQEKDAEVFNVAKYRERMKDDPEYQRMRKEADLSESVGSAAMCKTCGMEKCACSYSKMKTAEALKNALREKLASSPDWNKQMLAATTGIGALAGGLGTYLSSRAQKDTGKSKMEEDLGASVEANKNKPERGFLQKLKNREVESAHGIARVFREHPVKASLLGTLTGAAGGYGIGQLGGAIARLRGGK